MQIQIPRRADIIRAVRSIANPQRTPGLFDRRATGAVEAFESEILFAAAAFTTLLSQEARRTVRFKIDLKPYQAAPDVDYVVDIDDEANVTISIFKLPVRLVDAPKQFRLPLTVYVLGQAYLDTIARRWPEHDFGVRNPAERFMMDALRTAPEGRDAARRAIFN